MCLSGAGIRAITSYRMGRLHVLFVSEIDRADQSIQQCREDVFYMNIRFLLSAQKIVGKGRATSVLGSAALIGVKGMRRSYV